MIGKQTRRTFTKEFKLDVINQNEKCDKITELVADIGLRSELIYRWRWEFTDCWMKVAESRTLECPPHHINGSLSQLLLSLCFF